MGLTCAIIFWACVGGVFYAYVGYPLVLLAASRAFGRDPVPPQADQLPTLSLLICAHNEEDVIGQRIENALAMDYPRDRLEIVIASDGSSDRTVEIARGYLARGVRVLDFRERGGKSATLNAAFPHLRGDVVLLSDSNTFTEMSAARMLVRWFVDPAVGVVCGRLVLTDPSTGANADGAYWRYETFLKRKEARLGALLGANGAIYAIRRGLFVPLRPDTIVDDFVLPLLARLRGGCRIVYDTDAVAHEESAPDTAGEFRRRARIGAGAFQAVGMLWPVLDPRHGWLAFCFLSHKLMRWACPFFMIGALVTSLLLSASPLYLAALGGQTLFYAGGMWAGRSSVNVAKPLRLAAMFVGMNAALLVGFVRWSRGTQGGTWTPTARQPAETAAARQAA